MQEAGWLPVASFRCPRAEGTASGWGAGPSAEGVSPRPWLSVGQVNYPKVADSSSFDEDSSDALSPEQPASHESQGSAPSPLEARVSEPPPGATSVPPAQVCFLLFPQGPRPAGAAPARPLPGAGGAGKPGGAVLVAQVGLLAAGPSELHSEASPLPCVPSCSAAAFPECVQVRDACSTLCSPFSSTPLPHHHPGGCSSQPSSVGPQQRPSEGETTTRGGDGRQRG